MLKEQRLIYLQSQDKLETNNLTSSIKNGSSYLIGNRALSGKWESFPSNRHGTGSKTKCTTPCKIEGYEAAIFTSIS